MDEHQKGWFFVFPVACQSIKETSQAVEGFAVVQHRGRCMQMIFSKMYYCLSMCLVDPPIKKTQSKVKQMD